MEHLTQKQIEDYSHNRLRSEVLSVTDHLSECETCRRRIESSLNGEAAFLALHEQVFGEDGYPCTHLTPEQVAEYIDKHLAGEELQIVSDHLSTCEQCLVAVDDLRSFRNEIAPSLEREFRPASVTRARVKSPWGERFGSFFRASPVPAFGSAALALLVLATIGWLIWRTPREREPEVVIVPTPSSQPARAPESPSETRQPEAATPVLAQLNDGHGLLTLDQEGHLSGADNLPANYQRLLKKTLTTEKIERSPQLQGLTRPPGTLMSSAAQKSEFSVLEPVGRVLISNQPTFLWSTMEDAGSYVVEVYDEQFKLIASSPTLTRSSWSTRLPRGMVYSWQVKASKDGQEIISPGPPAPQAKFRILDQAKANELARAKRAYGASHLTLGLLFAEAGLLREAEQEFRLLRRRNPNSDLALRLLRQVQALRR